MSERIKKGWKVGRVVNGKIKSATAPMSQPGRIVTYLIGQWVGPNEDCGPLCCFTTEAAAEEFLTYRRYNAPGQRFEIYRCDYIPSRGNLIWGKPHDGGRPDKFPYQTLIEINKEAVLAKRIKLIANANKEGM